MYYYVENAQRRGPVAAEDLINCGVTAQTLVWKQGMANWAPAGEVDELKTLFTPQPPAFCPTSFPATPVEIGSDDEPTPSEQMMTLGQSITICFNKFAKFRGRASRAEFWWFYLLYVIGSFFTEFMDILASDYISYEESLRELTGIGYQNVWGLILLIPYLAVGVRRLHDTNHSGWWILCPIYNIILLATKGDEYQNEYGEPPVV